MSDENRYRGEFIDTSWVPEARKAAEKQLGRGLAWPELMFRLVLLVGRLEGRIEELEVEDEADNS